MVQGQTSDLALQKSTVVPRRARISCSSTLVSLKSRLEINKEDEEGVSDLEQRVKRVREGERLRG